MTRFLRMSRMSYGPDYDKNLVERNIYLHSHESLWETAFVDSVTKFICKVEVRMLSTFDNDEPN